MRRASVCFVALGWLAFGSSAAAAPSVPAAHPPPVATPRAPAVAPKVAAPRPPVARVPAPPARRGFHLESGDHRVETSPAAFAAVEARLAGAASPRAAGEVGHALAKEIRAFLPAYLALHAKDANAAEAKYGSLLEATSTTVSALYNHAAKAEGSVGAALLSPVARALDEGGAKQNAQILFRRIESNDAAPPADRAFALSRVADAFVEDVRVWQKEPVTPFEQAVLQIRGAPGWHGALGQATFRLRMAADLEPDPARKSELFARSKVLEGEMFPVAVAKPVDTSSFSSRDRRLLQALVQLKERGYDLAIDRASEPSEFHFLPPSDGQKVLTVGYGRGDGLRVPAAADDVLRHELQHLYDWSQGKLKPLGQSTAADHTRAELRANYAATKDVSKAIAMTRVLHPATALEIDGLRAQIEGEWKAAGRGGNLDRAVFARSMRSWREVRGGADPGPEGGPVRADATP